MLPRLRQRMGLVAGALLSAFLAFSLLLPLLGALRLTQETGMAAAYCLAAGAITLVYGLLPKRARFLVPLLLIIYLGASFAFNPGSLVARLIYFVRSLMSGAGITRSMTLYLSALLPLLSLLGVLFGRLLMEGDPAFTLPLMVAPLLLAWQMGARAALPLYAPAVLSLPLLYLYINSDHSRPEGMNRPRSVIARAMALALALTLAAFALTPAHRQTQPEAERLAGEVRRRVEDLFFFTAQRNMFTLGSQGYQPMGERGLGGRPDISRTPVMNVRTTQRVYLRGTALDNYSGRAWYDTLSNQRFSWTSLRYAGLREELFDETLPQGTKLETQQATMTLLSPLPSTLFVPQRLRGLQPGPDMVPYFNSSSEVFITRDLENGDSYAVRYEAYVAGEARTDALAGQLALQGGRSLPELPVEYTALPGHLQPDGIIANLARDITAGQTQPYAQALSLMRYLKSNYAYSIEVPPAPENVDFAAHFLFEQRTGYCTYFATAMTVLARSLNLPARYVEGFLANPQGADSVTLTGMNAHAWTEVYIAGLGWVVFDATASDGAQEPEEGPQPPEGQQPPQPSPSPSPSPEPSEEPTQEPTQQPGPEEPSPPPEEGQEAPEEQPQPQPDADDAQPPKPPFPWWWLLLLLALALLVWQLIAQQPERRARKLNKPAYRLALYWQAWLEAQAAAGQAMGPQETPLSYAARIAPETADIHRLAAAHSAAIYGRGLPNEDMVSLSRSQYQAAWAALPWYKQAGLSLQRAMRPLRLAARKAFLQTARLLQRWRKPLRFKGQKRD